MQVRIVKQQRFKGPEHFNLEVGRLAKLIAAQVQNLKIWQFSHCN